MFDLAGPGFVELSLYLLLGVFLHKLLVSFYLLAHHLHAVLVAVILEDISEPVNIVRRSLLAHLDVAVFDVVVTEFAVLARLVDVKSQRNTIIIVIAVIVSAALLFLKSSVKLCSRRTTVFCGSVGCSLSFNQIAVSIACNLS